MKLISHEDLNSLMEKVGFLMPSKADVTDKLSKWKIVQKDHVIYAFGELRCVTGFTIAARVGYDGLVLFQKADKVNSAWLTEGHFATLQDFSGSKGGGFEKVQVGYMDASGYVSFSDCIFEPGIVDEDYMEVKKAVTFFGNNLLQM